MVGAVIGGSPLVIRWQFVWISIPSFYNKSFWIYPHGVDVYLQIETSKTRVPRLQNYKELRDACSCHLSTGIKGCPSFSFQVLELDKKGRMPVIKVTSCFALHAPSSKRTEESTVIATFFLPLFFVEEDCYCRPLGTG